jgi:Ca-activated chloride channel family protein
MTEYRTPYLLIFGIIAMTLWALDYWKVFQKVQLHLSNIRNKKSIDPLRISVFILGVIAWLCLSYSLMGPRKPLKFMPSSIEVNDIFFVVDVSRSMLADDLPPNRLEVAKKKIREFIKLRPTDRIGIVIFSERVFTLLPLTTDNNVVDEIINDIQVGNLGGGTNIGDALGLAVARAVDTETKNKVIILLTDGVNNVGNMSPIQAAELAQKYKIKVYTIGIGTDDNARIPVRNGVFGTKYQVIPGGSIDIKTLEKISSLTGGKTYVAKSELALKEILDEIQNLEKTKIDSSGQVVYEELYYFYLLWGLILLFSNEFIRRFYIREYA